MFPHMDEYQFATFFIAINQERIKKELKIKQLCMVNAIKTVQKFVIRNKKNILAKFKSEYDSLSDKEFLISVINVLKSAKKRGVILEIKML